MPKKGSVPSDDELPWLKRGDTVEDNAEESEYNAVSPSGAPVSLLSQGEVDFYETNCDRYNTAFKLDNVSDILELDRILLLEVMVFRWGQWMLNQGLDYQNSPVNFDLSKNIKEFSNEIRNIKAALGVDKKTRELSKGGNTANFINTLLERARQFGYHRNDQVIKAYTNWKELQGLITLYENCIPSERSEFACHEPDIIDFIKEKCEELDLIDERFRNEQQRYWIRDFA